MPDSPPLGRILRAAIGAICVGLTAVWLLDGPSSSGPVRLLEFLATLVAGVAVLGGVVAFLSTRLGGWRHPASEEEFELLVQRSERLAHDGVAADPLETEFMELDPLSNDDFAELVRDALDDLPDLLQNALKHVPVVISDLGRRHRAYGLYQGDGAHRDDHPDRIVIFRDTLRRDFGADPDALREQVTRTVRHELAHHVGFDEMGVKGLGL
ncbi:MAG: metallopeptidase family protein [Solirubrobacteraceae bacterium]